jgi:hypothetical protein
MSAIAQKAKSLRSELSEKEDTINDLEEKLIVPDNQYQYSS